MSTSLWVGIAMVIVGIILMVVAAIFFIVRKDMAWWVWLIGIVGFIALIAGVIFLIAGYYQSSGTTTVINNGPKVPNTVVVPEWQ